MTQKVEVTAEVTVIASQTTRQGFGPGVHEVPDDVAEDLLQHRLVQEADQSDGDEADDEADPETADWDATDFVDNHHATVRNAVEDGQVDDALDAVEAAEEDRDSPRDSVLQALSERREQVQG